MVKLFSKGIISLANILTSNGNLKPWSFFNAKGLNANDYFLLLGIVNSLPLAWKKLVKTQVQFRVPSDSHNTLTNFTLCLEDDVLSLDELTSSKLYWKLVKLIQVPPSARHKYTILFHDPFLTGKKST